MSEPLLILHPSDFLGKPIVDETGAIITYITGVRVKGNMVIDVTVKKHVFGVGDKNERRY